LKRTDAPSTANSMSLWRMPASNCWWRAIPIFCVRTPSMPSSSTAITYRHLDFTLTFSHYRFQTLMHRAFVGREGEWITLTLPSHFGSHSFTLINVVRARNEKSEGDVRENRLPSRSLSPLCIGIWGLWCEKVRDILNSSVLGAQDDISDLRLVYRN
jgi:hypothetical protein